MANEFRVKNGLITPKIISEESDGRVVLTQTGTIDNEPIILAFETAETDMEQDDIIGKISFAAPSEGSGSNALLVAAGIQATSEGDFAANSNATKLELMTASNGAATTKLTISSAGAITATGTLNVEGATTLDGAVTLGNATDDDIVFTGYVASDIIPKTTGTYSLGSGTLGFHDLHLEDGGIINWDNGDMTITQIGNEMTIAGGKLVVGGHIQNANEDTSTGTGVHLGSGAIAKHQLRTSELAKDANTNTFYSALSINNTHLRTSSTVTEADTNVTAEEMFHLMFINLNNTSYNMYHSVEAQCQAQVKVTSGDAHKYTYQETIRAQYKSGQSKVEYWTVDSHWHNEVATRSTPPGEFCAQRWSDGSNLWLVISYVNYKATGVGHTINVGANINALQMPVIDEG